jgi:uncharacterized protein YegP (UPF0339 family)
MGQHNPPLKGRWEIYRDRAGEYRARFKLGSETILTSEGYLSKDEVRTMIARAKRTAEIALVHDMEEV